MYFITQHVGLFLLFYWVAFLVLLYSAHVVLLSKGYRNFPGW